MLLKTRGMVTYRISWKYSPTVLNISNFDSF